jgi:hypothetical protein
MVEAFVAEIPVSAHLPRASATVRAPWYEQFRQRRDTAGYRHTSLLIGDEDGNGKWTSAEDLSADPALRASVAALGGHYPCRGNPKGTGCAGGDNAGTGGAPSLAQSLGLPLWASEMGSDNYVTGGVLLPRRHAVRRGRPGRLRTDLGSADPGTWFVKDAPLRAVDGAATATLRPNHIHVHQHDRAAQGRCRPTHG